MFKYLPVENRAQYKQYKYLLYVFGIILVWLLTGNAQFYEVFNLIAEAPQTVLPGAMPGIDLGTLYFADHRATPHPPKGIRSWHKKSSKPSKNSNNIDKFSNHFITFFWSRHYKCVDMEYSRYCNVNLWRNLKHSIFLVLFAAFFQAMDHVATSDMQLDE